MRRLRAIWHRAFGRPHQWTCWDRLKDGDAVLIVERCEHQPWCRAVRSYPYQALIPDSMVDAITAQLTAPNPWRHISAVLAASPSPKPSAERPASPAGWDQASAAFTSRSRKAKATESASAAQRPAGR